ncbi:hypothetical protein DNAM_140 [Pseudomonas phage BroderSalsa]|nr:hypothetical protein DNAM_140 [Pseudomonas phage BroderSalsa]
MRSHASFETKGYTLTDAALEILPENVSRKGLVIGNNGSDPIAVAIGLSPGVEDFFMIPVGKVIQFDQIVPIHKIWAKGPGVLVLGEVT